VQPLIYGTEGWNNSEPLFKLDIRGFYTEFGFFFITNVFHLQCFNAVVSFVVVRVRPPVDLSTHASEDGGQLIQWSSPYPAASQLSQKLTFQLGYRAEGEETWRVGSIDTPLLMDVSKSWIYQSSY